MTWRTSGHPNVPMYDGMYIELSIVFFSGGGHPQKIFTALKKNIQVLQHPPPTPPEILT